jgi:hypothetical protein
MLVLGTRARRRFVAMQAGSGWTPPESGAGQRVGGVVLTGVGAGGILVGSAVGIANAIGYRPADPMESDAARRTRQLRTRALIGGLAVGGAAAVATGVILLWRGRRRARAHQEAWRARAAALVPTIAATGRTAIVGLAGRW